MILGNPWQKRNPKFLAKASKGGKECLGPESRGDGKMEAEEREIEKKG